MPVFNGARFIEQALHSVVAQRNDGIEIIVVDDASTDGTADLVRAAYTDVTLIELTTNRGPSSARNRGVAAATGDFVAFIDADDLWLPGKIGLQLEWLRLHPNSGFVTGLQETFIEPGCRPPPWATAMMARESAGVVPSAWLMRRHVLDVVGPFDESFRHAEDIDWLTRATYAGISLDSLDQVVFRKRIHDQNLTLDQAPSDAGLFRALRASAHRHSGHPE